MDNQNLSEEELKRIHGDDVELAPDDSEDDKLAEKDALKQAAEQGIFFKDTFFVVKIGEVQAVDDPGYDTYDDAARKLNSLKDKQDYTIVQQREQLPQNAQTESE